MVALEMYLSKCIKWYSVVLFIKRLAKKKQDKALDILHSFTRNIIDERFAEKENKTVKSRRLAFLDVLMNAKTEDGQSLSKDAIQEEVDTFMFEGHDTSGMALTWNVYLLGRHKNVQSKV